MGKYKRYKNSIEKFLSGDSGKRFFNFAYSIGAAIVIWGALFKILHLPGGNVMLSIGMGVEVVMFILTAFDRPAKEYHWEEVFPVLASKDPEDRPDFKNGGGIVINGNMAGENGIAVSGAEARRIAGIPSNIEVSEEDTQNLSNSIQKLSAAADQISRMAELTDATQKYLDQMAAISEQMIQFRQAKCGLAKYTRNVRRVDARQFPLLRRGGKDDPVHGPTQLGIPQHAHGHDRKHVQSTRTSGTTSKPESDR